MPRIPSHGISLAQSRVPQSPLNGYSADFPPPATTPAPEARGTPRNPVPESAPRTGGGHQANLDGHLIAAAAAIIAEARQHGHRLSQKALGDKLRRDGHRVANHNLHALVTAASALATDIQADGGNRTASEPAPATTLRPADVSHLAMVPAWPARQTTQNAADSSGGP